MARALKLFGFSISILLILQSVNSAPRKSKDSDTDSNTQDGEEVKPTLFKNFDRLSKTRAGQMARQFKNMAKNKASKLSKEFKNSLVEDSKKHVNDTDSNAQDGEEVKPTLFKIFDRLSKTRAGQMARQFKNMAKNKASKLSKEFKNSLVEDSKKHVNGENDLIPNGLRNNVLLPIKAAAQASLKTFGEPAVEMMSNVKKKFDEELEKADQDENYVPIISAYTTKINKPVALVKASRHIIGDAMEGMQKTASSIWYYGKDKEDN